MAYTQQEIDDKLEMIFKDIAENGMSLRQAVKGYEMPCMNTVLKWLSESPDKMRQYVHAREARADLLFEEILEIADKQGEDVIGTDEFGNEIINHNIIHRNRLQIDARKWMLGKMSPNRFGDKLDITSGNEPIQNTTINLSGLSNKLLEELEAAANPEKNSE